MFSLSLVSPLLPNSPAIFSPKPYLLLRSLPNAPRACLHQLRLGPGGRPPKSAVIADSLKLLEWDKLCESVSSFAGTPLGRDASKAQLWKVDLSYEESKVLLDETAAAIQLINYGGGAMDFDYVDVLLVKSAIDRASRGFPVNGLEAMSVVSLIQCIESLQATVEMAVKEDVDWYNRFMPLTEVIMDAIISRSLVKSVQQVIDNDGSVKDNASSELKRYREEVRSLERKLHQMMDKLIRYDKSDAPALEVCSVNDRWCIKTTGDQFASFDGLLLSSGSGAGSLIEPITAVPLNDELQQARMLVGKAEEDVLSKLTDKMLAELEHIQNLLRIITQLDVVAARAKYSMEYGGTIPDLTLPGTTDGVVTNKGSPVLQSFFEASLHLSPRKWKLYMSKAYHPLLLQKHRESLRNARKAVANATADVRRKLQGRSMKPEDDVDSRLASMKFRVSQLEKDLPVPVDFVISTKTGVLVMTGPNTGGKTISLKTVGLASLMAKTGVYVLASEPVEIPCFDAIYADIGDEQSLTQSLSTFSGHLKQISAIRAQSTSKSLVLLDEVGAGTNPLEGAALGMSILESFAETGSFLTIATTHHGELKTLKYSNDALENACVEFDEESLKPTYKILWGIPGRSNAINIAERLGLPKAILDSARKLHGTSSAEINGVIVAMESSKVDFRQHLQEAKHYLMLSRRLREDLLTAKQKIAEHSAIQRSRKVKSISDSASIARSILRKKLQLFRESAMAKKAAQNGTSNNTGHTLNNLSQSSSADIFVGRIKSSDARKHSCGKKIKIPKVGETVTVPYLGKQAKVLKVEASKGEIIVQASNLKLRLKLHEIKLN